MTILKLLALAPPFELTPAVATPRRGPTKFLSVAIRRGLSAFRTTATRR